MAVIDYGGYRPHVQGYGATTKGGRGPGGITPKCVRVNTLTDTSAPLTVNGDGSRSGSLRSAMEANFPRFIVFERSGTMTMSGPVVVTNPWMTIAAQTAPSPGVTIKNWGFYFDSHDLVSQHLRFRYGDLADTPGNNGCINGGAGGPNVCYNVLLDHNSFGWGMYMHVYSTNYNLTGSPPTPPKWWNLSDCLIAWGLSKGDLSEGLGCGFGHNNGTPSVQQHWMARTLMVLCSYRLPVVSSGRLGLVNVGVYGSGPSATDLQHALGPLIYKSSPDSENGSSQFALELMVENCLGIPSTGGSGATAGSGVGRWAYLNIHQDNIAHQNNRIGLFGNVGPGITGPTGQGQWNGMTFDPAGGCLNSTLGQAADIRYATKPSWYTSIWNAAQTIAQADLEAFLARYAGARPLDRDSVDTAAVSAFLGRTGTRITSQSSMGGWPSLAVNTRDFDLPVNAFDVMGGDSVGRLVIEGMLESAARELEGLPPGEEEDTGPDPVSDRISPFVMCGR